MKLPAVFIVVCLNAVEKYVVTNSSPDALKTVVVFKDCTGPFVLRHTVNKIVIVLILREAERGVVMWRTNSQ